MNVRTKRVSFNELRQKEETEEEENEENIRVETGQETSDDDDVTEPASTTEFTNWKEAGLLILVVFYVADIGLDLWVAVRFFAFRHPMNAWFVVFCILLPNLYAGYKSLQWYLRSHDLDPIRRPFPWIVRVAFFPISLLLRYYDTWCFGRSWRTAKRAHDRRAERRYFTAFLVEAAEVAMLRLFIIFLEDAPIAVLNLREVILTPPEVQKHRMEMVLVVIFKLLFTMTVGVVYFLTATKAVYHAAKSDQYCLMGSQWMHKAQRDHWEERGFLSLPAEVCIYLWHLCAIGNASCALALAPSRSRLVAYAMFVAVHQKHLWILAGIRWLLNTVWIKVDAWEISLTNCVAFGGVYLFSFVPTSPKPQLLRVLIYYGVTVIEDVVIAVLFSVAMRSSPYGAGGYGLVFGGVFASMVFMAIYYWCFHPRRARLPLFPWAKGRKGTSPPAA